MRKNLARRLVVAAMLTTWVVNPATVLAIDVHQDITTSNTTVAGALDVASTYQGGAVTISGAIDNVVLSGTFNNNSTTNIGGAVAVLDGASVSVADNTVFSDNHATNAGAFLNQASNVVIGNNVTFENNYADNYYNKYEACTASRMKTGLLLYIFNIKFKPVFITEYCFMLSTVVHKCTSDILHNGNKRNINYKYRHSYNTFKNSAVICYCTVTELIEKINCGSRKVEKE
jgi:hypothetical protein